MPRQPRIEFPGAVYHITARGNEGREIFQTNYDYEMFLKTLEEATERFYFAVHAYCLMPNHYHLIVETPEGNLSRGIGWLQTTYTTRYNMRHTRIGHLFQGRFKSHLVDNDSYGKRLVCYIHLNPVRPKDKDQLIPLNRWEKCETYPWSSHIAYREGKSCLKWLHLAWLKAWGKSLEKGRHEYYRTIKSYFGQKVESPWNDLKGGMVLGDEVFLEKIKQHFKKEYSDWLSPNEKISRSQKIKEWLNGESDNAVRLWLRVCLGGEKVVDVAREMNYQSGSGVINVINRLKKQATQNIYLKQKLSDYENRK
jgi:putative transposase